jgi:asparagine synthase (glutamine-hydrolysing)
MCGIAGAFNLRSGAESIDPGELDRVRDHMRARGPDGAATWLSDDGRIGLAHRRLAIIDLSDRAAQPMHAGSLSITFNGEIYNYRALRAELEADGEHFTSESDTEVLLKLFARHGVVMFSRLRGMYAFAIWDASSRELFLARDPFGIKPLYYGVESGRLWFASQTKALVEPGVLSAAIDPRAWNQFLLWGSIPEPRTAYAAVRAVPAGHWLRVSSDRGVGEPTPHFDLAACYRTSAVRADQRQVRDAVRDSVRHHLIADVPVGVFLSAGIDSAAVLGLCRDAGACPESLTLSFSEFAGQARDETPDATELAALYGSAHRIRRVDRVEFESDLPKILAAMDQPSIDGINTWFVSKAAREAGWKVALSGLGGDELFGGYPSFRDVPLWTKWLAWARHTPRLGEFAGRMIGRLMQHPKAQGLLRYGGTWSGAYFLRRGLFMPWEIEAERPSWLPQDKDAIAESLQGLAQMLIPDPGSDHARVSVLESGAYMRNQLLRDSDWASMAHSIELRVPLVDSVLSMTLGQHMPSAVSGPAKAGLARSPSTPLPDRITNRAKTGFETPVGQWMRDGLRPANEPWAREWARQVLSRQQASTEAA